jgi:tRNA 2-thiouridine synthesizing protein A
MAATLKLNQPFDQALDITRDRCPMTYVRVRLALDRMRPGQVLQVDLSGDEPLRNVPRTAAEQGHAVLACEPVAGSVTRILIRKG